MTAVETSHRDQLAALWRRFAELEAGPYSPLYADIARAVAEDGDLLDLVRSAPPAAHMPILLLAAAHDVVLRGVEHPLADIYAGRRPAAEAPAAFRDLCLAHRDDVLAVLATRRIQTNECGRSALIALGLAAVAELAGVPDVLVDAGASAGLNLVYDRYHLDYGTAGSRGDVASPVRVTCEIRNPRGPLPDLPPIRRRIGLDRSPIDVTVEEDARWLLACVWPDTGRLERTAAAIALAARDRPEVRAGDMVGGVADVIRSLDGDGLVCVLTSWAFAYLHGPDRAAFVASLVDASAARPVVWLSMESPGVVRGFPPPAATTSFEIEPSVVALTRVDPSGTAAEALALAHPHGSALEWVHC